MSLTPSEPLPLIRCEFAQGDLEKPDNCQPGASLGEEKEKALHELFVAMTKFLHDNKIAYVEKEFPQKVPDGYRYRAVKLRVALEWIIEGPEPA